MNNTYFMRDTRSDSSRIEPRGQMNCDVCGILGSNVQSDIGERAIVFLQFVRGTVDSCPCDAAASCVVIIFSRFEADARFPHAPTDGGAISQCRTRVWFRCRSFAENMNIHKKCTEMRGWMFTVISHGIYRRHPRKICVDNSNGPESRIHAAE